MGFGDGDGDDVDEKYSRADRTEIFVDPNSEIMK
jgi:hypothetical protein